LELAVFLYEGVTMPQEIFPSSYECDCGHISHFFENTIREAKAKSQRQEIRLHDSEKPGHIVVFYQGKLKTIICPEQAAKD
jgi:hypothetical protein